MSPGGPHPGSWPALAAALTLLLAAPAGADTATPPSPGPAPVAGAVFDKVDVIEKLGDQVPLDLRFVDSDGKQVTLADYVRGDKPLILTLVYYECPVLCNLVLSGLVGSIQGMNLPLGEHYRVLTVSVDPVETPDMARERKRGHLQPLGLGEDEADWPFLVGEDDQIKQLAEAVGFEYTYDEVIRQWAHAAVMMVLTPDGKVSRYLYGVKFPPRDLRLSLVEASDGRVGTSFDRLILTCFKYDPASRRYGFYVSAFLRIGGLLVFAALAGMLTVLWRREFKKGTI